MRPETQNLLHKAQENREAAALLLRNGNTDYLESQPGVVPPEGASASA